MKLHDLLEFRKDLYFEGAVQADWFYLKEKAQKVAENFVFHGSKYYGVENSSNSRRIDTVSFVRSIGEKLADESSNPLTLAIADYGTGKSHLAVTIGQLLSGPNYLPETFNKVLDNIKRIDSVEASKIKSLYNRSNLVLVINGMKDFNLHSEILKAAQKSLLLHGISDENLKKINKSIEIAEMFFERNFEIFKKDFEASASNRGWNEKDQLLSEKIQKNLLIDETAFDIINDVYELTTGHKIRWDEGLSAINILEELANDYCGADSAFDSIIILFDEFGRYLEYASGVDSGKSGDSALQQMFECSQNLEGKLHIINFIQSDIKTYLQRVDNTKNISRYIGRYDVSDKYYISSNLETVFANLIHRKDEKSFNDIIISKQNNKNELWSNIFNDLNRWCTTNGIWADFSLFRKVIVEGIYPMHPISTFMLSQLSDYLQNRSSLTLISQYIQNNNDLEIDDSYFTILPEQLMSGDLFVEMLSAEQEGKQSSQHCIRYYNVIRKYQDKINENHEKVLRSNLIIRVLKCKTSSLSDVHRALSYCSGLSEIEVKECLDFLENEYGILGYDDRANCYDFMEESAGAHDYKVFKKRMLASAKFDPFILRNNQEILSFTENDSNIVTTYGVTKRITSVEWQFKQSLFPAEDISEKIIEKYVDEWSVAKKPDEPKGRIIWAYICKDTSYKVIENLQKYSKLLTNKPIFIMVLNDSENRLYNDLIEYNVIRNMDESVKSKYERHYKDDYEQVKDRIKTEFNNLKKERLYITENGFCQFEGRLAKELTKVFETIYPYVPSFSFDGLISAKNNIAPKASNIFFTIVKLLLSSNLDSSVIHNYQMEVRNKIEAALFYKASTSWKCLNEQYHIVPPVDTTAKRIYDLIANELDEKELVNIECLFNVLTAPPYGLNTYSFYLMIAVVLSNLDYCTRVVYDDNMYSVKSWRDLLFVKEGKIELDVLKKSTLIKVDAGETEEKFLKLFREISDNKDIDRVERLVQNLERLLKEEILPERLEANMLLAKKTLDDGRNAKKEWQQIVSKIKKYNSEMTPLNVYPGFQGIELIYTTNFDMLFEKYKYEYMPYLEMEIDELKANIDDYIKENFAGYLNCQRCNEVERLSQFRNHGLKNVKLLRDIGYYEYAEIFQLHIDKEISNVERIKDKQNFKSDCERFFANCKINQYTPYVQIKEHRKEAKRLIELFNQYSNLLGKDTEKIKKGLIENRDLLKNEYDLIINEIMDIFDSVFAIKSIDDVYTLQSRIVRAINRGFPKKDKEALEELQEDLNVFEKEISSLAEILNRETFNEQSNAFRNKFMELETDISEEVVDCVIAELNDNLNQKEQNWIHNFLEKEIDTFEKAYRWKETIKVLPEYLSSATISKYYEKLEQIERMISKERINTAKHYYDLLSDEEKVKFKKLIINGDFFEV